ncbi:MAG: hypothetical protein K6T92_09725, partial [Candidatus Rokubacteria bacterium]|nr:hypothetical protein [Candidatus Rokubacteria bacterium]
MRELVRAVHHQGPRDASGTATEVIRRRPGLVASTLVANPDGRRVVAWDGTARWQPDSGQFLLHFDADEVARKAAAQP